jgi:hypothetical protein
MSTPFTDIYDLVMEQIDDYRLVALYNQDVLNDTTNLDTYLHGFMLLAIPEFSECSQDLSLRDDVTTKSFTETLTDINKKVLSKLMVKEWLSKEVKNILDMKAKIQDVDYKTYSEAQNITARQTMLTMFKEECSQLLIDYSYKNNSWTNWYSGNFSGL